MRAATIACTRPAPQHRAMKSYMLADYMRSKKNLPSDDRDSDFAKAIERYCDAAWAVKEFLRRLSLLFPRRHLPRLPHGSRSPPIST
jgi:hypothetical protein